MPCCSAWGCSNNSNTFKLYGFPFDRKILEAWEGNVNCEGWKAKPGISKLCEVGDNIILRSRSRRHLFPYDAYRSCNDISNLFETG